MKKRVTPDDEFVSGPFHFARFGRVIQSQPLWSEAEWKAWKRGLAEEYDDIKRRVDGLVAEIAGEVARLPPLELMLRARWFFMTQWAGVETESETDPQQVHSQRMVEYLQSVIASVPASASESVELTDRRWQGLSDRVEDLFRQIRSRYLLSRTFKKEAEKGRTSGRADALLAEMVTYWLEVRGRHYLAHTHEYLLDVLVPHTGLLESAYGVSGARLANELNSLMTSLTFGPFEAGRELEELWPEPPTEKELEASATDPSVLELGERMFGVALYDVTRVTSLPERFLHDLSWMQGEDEEFFSEGPYRGWPIREWPSFKRPFIRLDGGVYCFDLSSLFDNIYRVVQRALFRRDPACKERWNRVQSELTENLAKKYVERLLPGARVWRGVHYKAPAKSGKREWCETDVVVAFDEHLFVLECRAGSFTHSDPATDFEAYRRSLKNLVVKPANQGHRFLDHFNASSSVELFDRDHRQVGSLNRDDFRRTHVCAVTLDSFTELAARTQHLIEIGVDVEETPAWSVSIDDLRVFADVFTNPMVFLDFVEQRVKALTSDAIACNDELDHVGLYLEHRDYAGVVEGSGMARPSFLGYRGAVDRFFARKLIDPAASFDSATASPELITQILAILSRSTRRGRFRVAERLLGTPTPVTKDLERRVLRELKAQTTRGGGGPRHISQHLKGLEMTVSCWMSPWSTRNRDDALEHARTVAFVTNDTSRLLLELSFSEDRRLRDVWWEWIDIRTIGAPERGYLVGKADAVRRRRIARAKAERGKIGRNDPCPCMSGRKWKKCCLLRT